MGMEPSDIARLGRMDHALSAAVVDLCASADSVYSVTNHTEKMDIRSIQLLLESVDERLREQKCRLEHFVDENKDSMEELERKSLERTAIVQSLKKRLDKTCGESEHLKLEVAQCVEGFHETSSLATQQSLVVDALSKMNAIRSDVVHALGSPSTSVTASTAIWESSGVSLLELAHELPQLKSIPIFTMLNDLRHTLYDNLVLHIKKLLRERCLLKVHEEMTEVAFPQLKSSDGSDFSLLPLIESLQIRESMEDLLFDGMVKEIFTPVLRGQCKVTVADDFTPITILCSRVTPPSPSGFDLIGFSEAH